MVRGLARAGRERDAATLSSLHRKLVNCSRDIIRNRTSILALLHSLSEKESSKAQPSPFTSSINNSHVNALNSRINKTALSVSVSNLRSSSLSHSTSHPTLASQFHPPLPPKPKSRPPSLCAVDNDSYGPANPTVDVSAPTAKSFDLAPSEQDLVRELVFVFQGIEGSIIKRKGQTYTLDPKVFFVCTSA